MKNKYTIFLLVLLIIPLFSLFTPGLPITHDGQDHVARIANFYANIQEGNIIPRWAGNLNWGYGHPILEFLYPAPSYFASFFHFIGFSLVDSTKIVFGLGMFLSGLFMYLWLSFFLKKESAFFGSVLYVYAPYRFVDLYVRGAIGENFAFIWLPLILLFIYRLFKAKTFTNLALIGIFISLLILSHNALSVVFLPFIFFYALFLGLQLKNKKGFLGAFCLSVLLGFSISAFFWLPSLIEGKYTLRNLVRTSDFSERYVTLRSLVWGPWSFGGNGQLTVQIGIINLFALFFSIFILTKTFFTKNQGKFLLGGLVIYSIVTIFLMTKYSAFFWKYTPILWDFQFPWRLLSVVVFSTSVLGAISIDKQKNIIRKIIISVSLLILLFVSSNYWNAKGYLNKNEAFFTQIYNSTTDTGESSPIWSVRFMEKRWKEPLEVIDGSAQISQILRKQTLHEYKINVNKKTLFRENTLFFPGWEISANGKIVPIEFQNPEYRGLMTFFLDKGNYTVKATYKDTKVRFLSNMISLVSIGVIFFLVVMTRFKLWQKSSL